jgi:hypothetical protein
MDPVKTNEDNGLDNGLDWIWQPNKIIIINGKMESERRTN